MSSTLRSRKSGSGGNDKQSNGRKSSKSQGRRGGGDGAASVGVVRRWARRMYEPVPAHGIAFARMFWGLVMMWEIWTYMQNDYGKAYHQLVKPTFVFHYYGFGWVPRMSMEQWQVFLQVMFAFGLMFSVGLLYHVAAFGFAFGFTFLFLQDMTFYLNHFYLVIVLCFAYAFVPANKFFALDSLLGLSRYSPTVPFWTVFMTRALVSVVYVHAGVAKMNEDWIRGEPLAHWLPRRSRIYPDFAWFFDSYEGALAMSWGGLLFDTFVPFVFLIPGIRPLAFVGSFMFHLLNKLIFNIGIFPLVMTCVTTIFFRPDWPRVVFRYVTRHATPLKHDERREAARHNPATPLTWRQTLTVSVLFAFLAQQTLMPLRHHLYHGQVVWNEEGHMCSWRMKLRDKAGMTKFYLKYPHPDDPSQEITDMLMPQELLTNQQVKKMGGRPQMMVQFANYVADLVEEEVGQRPRVHVHSIGSVNYRVPQLFIDPTVDLASIKPWSWVTGYVLDLLPRGTTDHPYIARDAKPAPGDTSKTRLYKMFGHLHIDEAIEQLEQARAAQQQHAQLNQ